MAHYEKRATEAAPRVEGKRKSSLLRFLRDTKGTATVEAVIMIPFFVLVWGFLLYSINVYKNGINAGLRVRECAWTYAQAGCDSVPPTCQQEPEEGETISGGDAEGIAGVLDTLRNIPVLGTMVEGLFGEMRVGTHRETVARPAIIGGESVQVVRTFAVMCNERPRTLGEMALGVMCQFTGIGC